MAVFFDPQESASGGRSGLVSQWPNRYRTQVAREITLAATGAKPEQGYPCLTIADRGEGQAPEMFPETLLSMHRSNKLRIPFVQGKFNMGGTGALRFCGKDNLQLVVSKRNPALGEGTGGSDSQWGFTVVRRQEEGGRNEILCIPTSLRFFANRDLVRAVFCTFLRNPCRFFPRAARRMNVNLRGAR